FVGYRPHRTSDSLGILLPHGERLLRSVNGFESIAVVTVDRPLIRHTSGVIRTRAKGGKLPPSMPDVAPAESAEDDLDRKAEELRKRMEEVQRELRGIETQKRKRLEQRRADCIRQAEEHEQQARDLRRQAAEAESLLAAMKFKRAT
ncbi:hypothetical protein L0Y59_03470, partial [Candidatus Uhrbacteria bacterium]|nr:hypothetical protein [Candidatus Uhrbacteria bacterium]